MDQMAVEEAAKRFHYKASTVYALLRDAKAGRVNLFPTIPRKKKPRKIPTLQRKGAVKK
jgi:transposase